VPTQWTTKTLHRKILANTIVAVDRAPSAVSTGPGWDVIDKKWRRYWYVGWEVVKRPYVNAAIIPPQTSTLSTQPLFNTTGVPKFHSDVHTPKVAAVTPPPALATAPIRSWRKTD
jgi:hypothetical protein